MRKKMVGGISFRTSSMIRSKILRTLSSLLTRMTGPPVGRGLSLVGRRDQAVLEGVADRIRGGRESERLHGPVFVGFHGAGDSVSAAATSFMVRPSAIAIPTRRGRARSPYQTAGRNP